LAACGQQERQLCGAPAATLIQINTGRPRLPNFAELGTGELSEMPTETMVVVGAITLAFLVFALTLAWADSYTKNVKPPHSNS